MHRGIKQHINNGTIGKARTAIDSYDFVLEAPFGRDIKTGAMQSMRAGRVYHLIRAFGPGQHLANKVDEYFQNDPGQYKESGYRWTLCELDKVFNRLFGDPRNRGASPGQPADAVDFNTLNDPDIHGRAGRFGRYHSATYDLDNDNFPKVSTSEAKICHDYAIPSAWRWQEEKREKERQAAPWRQHRR